MVGFTLVAAAFAQEEPCQGTLAADEWRGALEAVDSALVALDVDRADRIIDDVVDSLRCLGEPAQPEDIGRMARQLAVLAFYDSDTAELASWTWLERDVVGGLWPEALEVPTQFHVLRAELPEPPVVRSDASWAPPKKGVVWLDGRPSTLPEARSEVRHFMQALDKKGGVVWGGWMLGASAPQAWVTTGQQAVDVPKWVVSPPSPEPWRVAVASVDVPSSDATIHPEPLGSEPLDPETEPDPEPDSDLEASPEGRLDPEAVAESNTQRTPKRKTEFQEIFPECPWRAGPAKVSIEGKTLRVNRYEYPTGTEMEVVALQDDLRACGEFRAARRASRWVEARKGLFSSGKSEGEALVAVLLEEEPRRKRSEP